jgi:hypothetical protein
MDIVLSVDDSLYMHWQVDLLHYSLRRLGMSHRLVVVVSSKFGPAPKHPFSADVILRVPGSRDLIPDDDYSAYNKVIALKKYAEWPEASPEVVIVDPDFVFTKAFPFLRGQGDVPIGHQYWYLEGNEGKEANVRRTVLKRHCRVLSSHVGAVGVPVFLKLNELRDIVKRWMEVLLAIREDPVSRELVGWVAEMWAYNIAAAEAGLAQQGEKLAAMIQEPLADKAMIHYCDAVNNAKMDKRAYRPWGPALGLSTSLLYFIQIIEEFRKTKNGAILGDPEVATFLQ